MAVKKDERFYQLVEERKEEEYQRYYKENFTQVYMITYSECGDGDKAEAVADEEAADYAEYMLRVIEDEIEEDIEEMLEEEEA